MQDNATQKNKYDAMVHLWPITVEIYPTGKVAFVARPQNGRKRWNKTFSTSTFSSAEEASREAIEFCKRVQSGFDEDVNAFGKIRERKRLARYQVTQEEFQLLLEAKKLGADIAGWARREIERLTLANLQAKWGNPK
jgi:hypothetical protein